MIVSLSVVSVLLISLFFLSKMVLRERAYLEPTSPLRFTVFIIEHVFIMFMMIWFMFLEDTYGYVKWAFALSLINSLMLTGTEVSIFVHRSTYGDFGEKFAEPLEMAYLNCYFLIYMYSLITAFLSGLFIILTNIFATIQERRIRRAV